MGAAKESEREATERRIAAARATLDELISRKVGTISSFGRFGVFFEVKSGEVVQIEIKDEVTYR